MGYSPECSRRNWCEAFYKGRIHGTWWQLDDKLDVGSEDNSSVLDDPEALNLGMSNVFLLLLGYTWESWPWPTRPCDIWLLTPVLASLTITIPLIYCATSALTSQFLEPTRLLPNSKLPSAICGINVICLTSYTLKASVYVLFSLGILSCPHPQTRVRSLLYSSIVFCSL